MEPEVAYGCFSEFFIREIVEGASNPYDSVLRDARDYIGPLSGKELLAYAPPLLLSGDEDPQFCVKLEARTVMVANGDVFTQVEQLPEDAEILGVTPYIDNSGRGRLGLDVLS